MKVIFVILFLIAASLAEPGTCGQNVELTEPWLVKGQIIGLPENFKQEEVKWNSNLVPPNNVLQEKSYFKNRSHIAKNGDFWITNKDHLILGAEGALYVGLYIPGYWGVAGPFVVRNGSTRHEGVLLRLKPCTGQMDLKFVHHGTNQIVSPGDIRFVAAGDGFPPVGEGFPLGFKNAVIDPVLVETQVGVIVKGLPPGGYNVVSVNEHAFGLLVNGWPESGVLKAEANPVTREIRVLRKDEAAVFSRPVMGNTPSYYPKGTRFIFRQFQGLDKEKPLENPFAGTFEVQEGGVLKTGVIPAGYYKIYLEGQPEPVIVNDDNRALKGFCDWRGNTLDLGSN